MSFGNKIVACHQPNLFPPLNFWAKLAAADIFVLLDEVQFTRGGKDHYFNRCKIGDGKWLTIPVKRSFPQLIKDVSIMDGWDKRRFIASLMTQYPKGTFSHLWFDNLFSGNPSQRLSVFTSLMIFEIRKYLDLDTAIVLQSDLGLPEFDSPDERLITITKLFSDTYLSGPGGLNYGDKSKYQESGVNVLVSEYIPLPYPRNNHPFIPYLSILDAIAYLGKDVINHLVTTLYPWVVA